LVAEADAAHREVIAFLLDRSEGMRVVGEAVNGPAAIEITARLKPDVVLLDAAMPGLVLADTLSLLRERHAACRVIVLASEVSEELFAASFRAGAAGYMTRGVEVAELVAAIRAVHHGYQFVSQLVHQQLDVPALLPSPLREDPEIRDS